MPVFVFEHPYVWVVATVAMIAVGFLAASGWGSWGRR
jgi:hypothetical protein